MCFLIIILAVLIMIAFYGMSFGFLLFVAIVTGIATILNANGYAKSLRYRPTRKICPACNGTNISFNMVPSIAESSTWNYTRRWSQTNTKISNSKMAICNDCGQSFGYVTESDYRHPEEQQKGFNILFRCDGSCNRSNDLSGINGVLNLLSKLEDSRIPIRQKKITAWP